LHMAQLMPLPLTVSCFSKIQIGFTFLVPAHPGNPDIGPLNGCVCVCVLDGGSTYSPETCYFPSKDRPLLKLRPKARYKYDYYYCLFYTPGSKDPHG